MVLDDEFYDPLSLDDHPGARTPPTPSLPVVPSPSPSPAPMRQRAMEHILQVSIPDIVCTCIHTRYRAHVTGGGAEAVDYHHNCELLCLSCRLIFVLL